MLVTDLRERMSAREYLEWQVFYGRRRQDEEIAAAKAKGGNA